MRADAHLSDDGVKRANRPIDRSRRKHLNNSSPIEGVGGVAQFALESGDIYELTRHPCLDFINCPNPYETKDVFWGMDFLQREIFGNAYSIVFTDDSGRPVEMRHMYGQHVRIHASKTNWIDGYEYVVNGNPPEEFEPDEVAHFRYGGSLTHYQYGSSWFERCAPDMDILINARAVALHRYSNGMRADLAFLTPEFNPAQTEDLRKEITRRAVGVRNTGSFLILQGVTDIKPLSLTAKEMQSSDEVQRATNNIRNSAGIPEAMFALNSSNLASALQADGQFLQASIQPLLCSHAQQLTAFLCRYYDVAPGDAWFAYDNIVEPNEDENIKTTISMLGADLLVVNEARERVGYAPLRDERGGLLLSELRRVVGMSLPQPPPQGEAITPVNAEPSAPDLSPQPMGRPPTVAPPAAKALPAPEPKVVLVSDLACGCLRCKGADAEAGAGESMGFSRANYDALKSNLETYLRRGAETGQYSAEALQNALHPLHSILTEGAQDGIGTLLTVPGGSEAVAGMAVRFDVHSPEVTQYVNNYTVKLAKQLSDARHDELRSSIARIVGEGQTPAQAAQSVRSVLADRSADDAERIARTESAKAYNQGGLKAWEEAGVTHKKWLLAPFACPLCEEIATKFNEPVALSAVFFPKGKDITVGDTTYRNDYEDIDAPPLHPQCRCTTVPSFQ
jgi:HK97 family phage portal protein